jgi:hypothetical protein
MIGEEYKKKNVSDLFLKPLLNIKSEKLKELNYVNSFLFNAMDETRYNADVLYLLFQCEELQMDIFIAEEEQRGMTILEKSRVPNGYLICYLLPIEYKEDYTKIIEGKYSKVSTGFKKLFPKFVGVNSSLSLQYLVFNKDLFLKKYWEKEFDTVFTPEMEYWQLYNIKNETFYAETTELD